MYPGEVLVPGLRESGGEWSAERAEVVVCDLEVAVIVRGWEGEELEGWVAEAAAAAAALEGEDVDVAVVLEVGCGRDCARKAARKLERKGRVDC